MVTLALFFRFCLHHKIGWRVRKMEPTSCELVDVWWVSTEARCANEVAGVSDKCIELKGYSLLRLYLRNIRQSTTVNTTEANHHTRKKHDVPHC